MERVGDKTVIHNYGRGGSGWSLSWGSSRIAVEKAMATGLRQRWIMTTFDPDTLHQDGNILRRIVRELDGKMALDCAVLQGGLIREGDPVFLVED